MGKQRKRIGFVMIHILEAGAALYCFFYVFKWNYGIYDSAGDGIVVARALCLLFSFSHIGKAMLALLMDSE